MASIIVGTAGHVDHGKSALVRALTGIEPDRLEEERRRGISIDLGFAHLDLAPDIRIGFVDVPGHERFVKNMLAGAAGIDAVLFIVAADESIKPQTREHFDICRLLGVRHGIIALTKADLVDRDILELVRLEVEEFTMSSFLDGAPIVPVSSVTSAGLKTLREKLLEMARQVTQKDPKHHFRLPVDRSFSLRGFGTVVTGTLVSGSVRPEEEVEIYPTGKRARVRGLHVHGSAVDRAQAGQRTAVNLAAVEPHEVARGHTLAPPGRFRATRELDCWFHLLPSAKPLKHRAPVHFHAATAEIEAQVRLLESLDPLAPGKSAVVRFVLREPVLLLPADRFIVRMFSPVVTIGGGEVLDIAPPRTRRAQATVRLKLLESGGTPDRIELLVREARFGTGTAELVARTGLLPEEIEQAAAASPLVSVRTPQPWFFDRKWWTDTSERLKRAVETFHREHPLVPGISKEELRSRELREAPPFVLDAVLASSKALVSEGETVRLAAHKLHLRQDEEQALERIESAFREAGLAVPSTIEVLARAGVETARARALLQILLREKKLVRISEDLTYHRSALDELRDRLAERKGQRFTVPVFKEWTGISRKYAIPLLEFMDRERVTKREGDERVIL